MKYKVDDKVRIKTWKRMEKEFGILYDDDGRYIDCNLHFPNMMEDFVNKHYPDRVVTIKQATETYGYYLMEGDNYHHWTDDMIDGLCDPPNAKELIQSERLRFLDLDDEI